MKKTVLCSLFNQEKTNSKSIANENKTQVPKKYY